MQIEFSDEQREHIKAGVHQKYSKVAGNPSGHFKYPTGRAGLEKLNYGPQVLDAFPEDVLASFCGVGNPFSLGKIRSGQAVLDIGCGAGVDTLIAGMLVGPAGKAVGVDLIAEMIERARRNLAKTSLENVSFEEASGEELPFPDESFDVIVSNGAFNLIPDKAGALSEAHRVLRPEGRLLMADQVLTAQPPTDAKTVVETWAR